MARESVHSMIIMERLDSLSGQSQAWRLCRCFCTFIFDRKALDIMNEYSPFSCSKSRIFDVSLIFEKLIFLGGFQHDKNKSQVAEKWRWNIGHQT